jgi:hypothetical protein
VATNSIAHERLIAIEKRLQHALIGVALWLVVIFPLIGWLVLQTYHFGKGGPLG